MGDEDIARFAEEAANKAFEKYDADGSNDIEMNSEATEMIDFFATYAIQKIQMMIDEAKEANPACERVPPSEERMKELIAKGCDPNGDGKMTRDEAINFFKRMLKDS